MLKTYTLLICSTLFLILSSCRKEVSRANENALSPATENAAIVIHSHAIVNDDSYNYNPCTDEWIQFTGEGQLILDYRINNNEVTGTYHFNIIHKETGIGETTGTVYHAVAGIINAPFSASFVNGSFTGNYVYNVLMQTQGNTDNFEYSVNFKVTVNANGDLIVEKFSETLKCK